MNGKYSIAFGLTCFALLCASAANGQGSAGGLSEGQKRLHTMFSNNLIRAAEKMPEEHYSFKPTPEVRSFGQLIGHVADAQYLFCAPVTGATNPAPGIEKGQTSKADLVKSLKEAFAYCEKAFAMSDAEAAQPVKFFGREQPKLTVLSFKSAHDMEHYGNVVTYMRMKGLVPPSSEGRQ